MGVKVLLILAGSMGAAGVVLAAAAAHAAPGAGLESAAYMLLFHAVALLAGIALLDTGRLWQPVAMVCLAGWVAGSAMFAGDIALRAFAGHRLFPMAAPTGGTVLILAWVGVVVAAIGGRH